MREHMRIKRELFDQFYTKIENVFNFLRNIEYMRGNAQFINNIKFIPKEACYDLFTVIFRVKIIEFLQDKYKDIMNFDAFLEKECRKELNNFNLGKILRFDKTNAAMKTTPLFDLYTIIDGRFKDGKYDNYKDPLKEEQRQRDKSKKRLPRPSEIIHRNKIQAILRRTGLNNQLLSKIKNDKRFRDLDLPHHYYVGIVFGLIDYFEAEPEKFKTYEQ